MVLDHGFVNSCKEYYKQYIINYEVPYLWTIYIFK